MPALSNPRWEQFAQAIVASFAGKTRLEQAQSTAYQRAGYLAKPGNSAEAAASRLLRRVKPILDRVKELQAEQNARIQRKLDVSKDRVARRLDLASTIAEEDRNPSAIATNELGIAKLFGHITDKSETKVTTDYANAQSPEDIGRMLLQQVDFDDPDEASIQAAIKANDDFAQVLMAIRDKAQGLTSEQ